MTSTTVESTLRHLEQLQAHRDQIQAELEDDIRTAVREARAQRATWAEIGAALRMTRQACWDRYRATSGR